MLTRRLIAAVAILLPLLIAASAVSVAAPGQNALVVTVTPEGPAFVVAVATKDGAPVEDAEVYLAPRYEPLALSLGSKTGKLVERTRLGATGVGGTLSVTLDEPGHYFLVAEKQGYSQGFFAVSIGPVISGVSVSADNRVYSQGETVTLTLVNGLASSITLPGGAPWEISRSNGETVFVPVSTMALVDVGPGETKAWTWDQEDSTGAQVKPGMYVVTLTTSEGAVTAGFAVGGLRSEKGRENPAPEMPPVRPFKDVTGDRPWGDPHVLNLYQKGIVRGRSADSFDPEGTLTRAEFVAMLLRACGVEPAPEEGQDAFPDVTPHHWSYACVYRAREMGILTPDEYPEGFGPDVPITRLEICVMAARALGLEGEAGQRAGETLGFQDCEQVELRYRGYVASATEWGVVKGYEDNTFRPEKNATRREAAVIIYRLMQVD